MRFFVVHNAQGEVVTFGETSFTGDIGRMSKRPGHVVTELEAPFVPEKIVPAPTAADVKAYAGRLLRYTDWVVIKAMDTGEPADPAIVAKRQAIRAASNELEAMSPIPTDFKDQKYWP